MQLLIGGVDKTNLLKRGTLYIDDNVNGRTTCSFVLFDKTGSYHPEAGDAVYIYDNDGDLIFAGTIDELEEIKPLGTSSLETFIQAVDWHQIADRRIVAEVYEKGDIVSDIDDTQADFQEGTLTDVIATDTGELELDKVGDRLTANNLLLNPRLSNNGENWTPYYATDYVDSSGEWPFVHTEETYGGIYQEKTGLTAGEYYVVSYYVKHKSGLQDIGSHLGPLENTEVRIDRGAWQTGSIITVPADGQWHLIEVRGTAKASPTDNRIFVQPGRGTAGVSEFWFQYAMFEQGQEATEPDLQGNRLSSRLDLSSVGTAKSSIIQWTANVPANTTLTIEANLSLDGGQTWKGWKTCTSGQPIPDITEGTDLSNALLDCRQRLETTDTTVTPSLSYLELEIQPDNPKAGHVVRNILNNYLSDENITEGMIQDGPNITKAVFNYLPVSQCLDEICQLSGHQWIINPDKSLDFFARTANTAPFSINESSDLRNVKVRKNRDNYRNKQYVRAGKDITTVQVREFAGDGKTRVWTVDLPIAKIPTVKVNSIEKTVGIRGVETGKDFYWQKGDKTISQDSSGTVLTSSDTLTIEYQGFYPIIVVTEDSGAINDRKTVEGGTGIYEHVEDRRDIDEQDAALENANSLLRRYARISKVLYFDTFAKGLKAGQLLPVNLPHHELVENMLISRVTITDPTRVDGILRYSIEAISGEAVGGWVNFFKRLTQKQQSFVIRENEILIRLHSFQDEFEKPIMEDEMTYTLHQYHICGEITCGTDVII